MRARVPRLGRSDSLSRIDGRIDGDRWDPVGRASGEALWPRSPAARRSECNRPAAALPPRPRACSVRPEKMAPGMAKLPVSLALGAAVALALALTWIGVRNRHRFRYG